MTLLSLVVLACVIVVLLGYDLLRTRMLAQGIGARLDNLAELVAQLLERMPARSLRMMP